MKKYFAILLVSLVTGFVSQAQEAPAEKKVTMKEELGISKDTDVKIKAIKEEYTDKIYSVQTNASLDDKSKKTQKKALMAEREEKINALLTKEQQEKYLEYKAKLKAQKDAQAAKN